MAEESKLTVSILIGLLGLVIYFAMLMMPQKPKRKRILPPDAKPDKDLLVCDATDCRESPSVRCTNCKTVYYCSSECQKKHWKYHKADCQMPLQKLYFGTETSVGDLEEYTKDSAKSKLSECGICHIDVKAIQHPLLLKECQHVFCFSCLNRWQSYIRTSSSFQYKEQPSCPSCWSKADDDREAILGKALLRAARASQPGLSEDQRLEACGEALEPMMTLGKPQCEQDILQANHICSHITVIRQDYKDALKLVEQNQRLWTKMVHRKKQVDALLAKGKVLGQESQSKNSTEDGDDSDSDDAGLDETTYKAMQEIQNEIMSIMSQGGLAQETDLVDCRLDRIQIYLLMKDWNQAKILLEELMTAYPDQHLLSRSQQRRVFMGFAQCLYEGRNYEGSIQSGEAAVLRNRHYPGVHKHLAMAHRSSGDLREAQKIAGQGVLYETPWDSDNVKEAHALWKQLMEEG